MRVDCPRCRRPVSTDNLNVSQDTALCRNCDEVFRLSTVLPDSGETASRVDLGAPPSGAWFERSFDGFRVGGSTRSLAALFIVPFFLVWSGVSLGGISGPLFRGEDVKTFTLLFGIPFILGSVLLGGLALQLTLGRVELVIDRNKGRMFTGVGPIGFIRRFGWDQIDLVRQDLNMQSSAGMGSHSLVLEGARRIRFGGFLSDERRYFMLGALKTLLAERR